MWIHENNAAWKCVFVLFMAGRRLCSSSHHLKERSLRTGAASSAFRRGLTLSWTMKWEYVNTISPTSGARNDGFRNISTSRLAQNTKSWTSLQTPCLFTFLSPEVSWGRWPSVQSQTSRGLEAVFRRNEATSRLFYDFRKQFIVSVSEVHSVNYVSFRGK